MKQKLNRLKSNFINQTTKSSLQVYFNSYQNKNPNKKKTKKQTSKRMSPTTSYLASMSVEGAIAIPLFVLFFLTILQIIPMYQQYGTSLETLHQRGKELAMYGYVYEEMIQTDDDMVKLSDFQTIKSVLPIMPFATIHTETRCYMRAWTGYNLSNGMPDDNNEEYVYITETGDVYHRSRNCTHLNLSIEFIRGSELLFAANANGQRYRPCELCGRGTPNELCYVTNYGDRYHCDLNCSSLKRTIKSIPISKVGSRRPCSRCCN